MLEIQRIRADRAAIVTGLENRHIQEAADTVDQLLSMDESRRKTITQLEGLRQESNQVAKSIGSLMKSGKKEEAEAAKAAAGKLRDDIKGLEQAVSDLEHQIHEILVTLPNIPHPSVPVGKNADDNVVVFEHEKKVTFDFTPLPHWELALKHGIIDWELGSKLTGSGFPVYMGKGAQLQRALITYFLQRAHAEGYIEIQPPLMVNEASGFATGQLPDKEGQMYVAERDGFYLIPTAEVPITNLYREDILNHDSLPVKNCGYTPCFRREAGSYGKDVKGLNRLHQFDKVEIVRIEHPDRSYEALEEMTRYVSGLLESLELPFRQLALCTGDATFTSAKTYDLEVYSAGQDRWLEVSSVSNFETFQSNRLKLRFRDENQKIHLAHTLNGSALALPRIVAALLENNQRADGSIAIPKVLHPFTGFSEIS